MLSFASEQPDGILFFIAFSTTTHYIPFYWIYSCLIPSRAYHMIIEPTSCTILQTGIYSNRLLLPEHLFIELNHIKTFAIVATSANICSLILFELKFEMKACVLQLETYFKNSSSNYAITSTLGFYLLSFIKNGVSTFDLFS